MQFQAEACKRLGSPLYAELLGRAAHEVVEGDVLLGVLHGDPVEWLA